MTTRGKARVDGRAAFIRSLPDRIKEAESNGQPVIVQWPADITMPDSIQRLYATLGCLVRFVP